MIPTEPGYYWIRGKQGGTAAVVETYFKHDVVEGDVLYFRCTFTSEVFRVDSTVGRLYNWFPKLEPPEGT